MTLLIFLSSILWLLNCGIFLFMIWELKSKGRIWKSYMSWKYQEMTTSWSLETDWFKWSTSIKKLIHISIILNFFFIFIFLYFYVWVRNQIFLVFRQNTPFEVIFNSFLRKKKMFHNIKRWILTNLGYWLELHTRIH